MVNFMTATPGLDQFPVADFKTAVVEALDRDGAAVFSYDDSRGYLPLREAYATGLRARGVPCSADSVQIVSGAQQGLDIVAKALLAPGDEVIVERPTYPGALAAFRSRGAVIRELPLTPGGPDLTELRRLMRSGRPRLLYLMPDFQNPTGYCYTAREREAIVKAAAKAGVFILEEDTFSDLDYGGRQLRPLAAIAGNGGTIHLRSFSKVLMPGLRLAFLVVPPELQPAVLAAKQATDIASSGLNQRALDIMMRRGSWERCLERMVESYRSRYQLMRSRLQDELPDAVRWYSYDGGLYFWLELPPQCAATQIAAELREAGVLVSPGREFFARRFDRQYIRLSCAAADPDAIERGCRALGQALQRRVRVKPETRPYPWL
jgi:DNA-binding transcriptional MocR family regulator